jgi:uncharacterized surface protein with fasciclin (FAS1) repeats
MFTWFTRLAVLSMISLVAACGGSDDDPPPPNVVQVAQADSRFSILAEAVVAADLAGTLSGPGPYTVFAPTNDAFAALLTELGLSKAQLLANKPLLTAVLTYHVLPARVTKAQVPAGKPITTVQGGIFKVDAVGADLVITDGRNRSAKILVTDVAASNGVVHALDRVILPADKTLVQTAQALPDFSILVEAVVAADLAGTLSGTGPFTVFAPSNAAFADLLTELGITKEALLANKPLLTSVLTYHVLPSRVLKADVPVGAPVTTVNGKTFSVTPAWAITDGRGRSARITSTDVLASKGVIHVIDSVVMPT